jgi:hypothetical protein
VVGYCLLAFRGAVPSLGLWTLGLRRYTYDQVAEYAGPGVLYVYEDLPSRVYAYRTDMSALLFLLLAGVDFVLTQILPNGFTWQGAAADTGNRPGAVGGAFLGRRGWAWSLGGDEDSIWLKGRSTKVGVVAVQFAIAFSDLL